MNQVGQNGLPQTCDGENDPVSVSDEVRLLLLGEVGLYAKGISLGAGLGRKELALVAYLALQPDLRASRDALTQVLWGDRYKDNARQSLRQALTSLRKALAEAAPDFLVVERNFVALRAERMSCDAWEFRACAERPEGDSPAAVLDLWRGFPLEGLVLPDTAYRDWVETVHREWAAHAVRVFGRAAEDPAIARHEAAVFAAIDRRLQDSPYDEETHRIRLRLLARLKGAAAALAAYGEMETRFQEEAGLPVSVETQALAAELLGTAPPMDAAHAVRFGRRRLFRIAAVVAVVAFFAAFGLFRALDRPPEGPTRLVFFVRPVAVVDSSSKTMAGVLTDGLATSLSLMPFTALAETEPDAAFRLEGGLRETGDGHVLSLRLLEARSGEALWSGEETLAAGADPRPALDRAVVRMTAGVRAELKGRMPPPDPEPEVAELLKQGDAALLGGATRAKTEKALEIFRRAVALQPSQPKALGAVASVLATRLVSRWSPDREAETAEAIDLLEKSMSLDATEPRAIFTLGLIYKVRRDFLRARMAWRLVLEFNPRSTGAYGQIAHASIYLGDPQEGLHNSLMAIRMDPAARSTDRNLFYAGMASFLLGKDADAATYLSRSIEMNPTSPDLFSWRAAALMRLGRRDEARRDAETLLRKWPDWREDHHLLQTHNPDGMRRLSESLVQVREMMNESPRRR